MGTGVICRQPYYAVSIVEAPGMGFVSRIGAHEIAHKYVKQILEQFKHIYSAEYTILTLKKREVRSKKRSKLLFKKKKTTTPQKIIKEAFLYNLKVLMLPVRGYSWKYA